ncbi:MAG: hypothetical protein JWR04_1611 [Rhodoglobus sp.]|nr:hypothetical protein [Rhodoglobus sp.]
MNSTCKLASVGAVALGLTAFGLVGATAANAAGVAPVGADDYYSIAQGGTVTVAAPGILANDTDPEGDALHVGNSFGYNGADFVQVNLDGSFQFTPSPNFYGEASFAYYPADDLSLGAQVTVHITVTPTVPNAPVVLVAADDLYSTMQDTALTVPASAGLLANDSGPGFLYAANGPAVQSGQIVINQDGSFTYTPPAGFSGSTTFGYRTTDGLTFSNDAMVTITVTSSVVVPPAPLVAGDDMYAATKDTVLTVPAASGLLVNDTMPATVYDVTGGGSTQVAADGSFVYTPPAGFVGTKTFQYRTTDGAQFSNFATITIVVSGAAVPPVGVPPTANPDQYATAQDTALMIDAASGLLANDSFPAGAVIDIDDVSGEIVAQLDGSFVYTPVAGFSGSKEFNYRMSDGTALSAWAHVTITVAPAAGLPGGGLVPTVPTIPGGTTSTTDLPTLAYTGGTDDVSTWLSAPAAALIGIGGLGLWYSRRRAQLS